MPTLQGYCWNPQMVNFRYTAECNYEEKQGGVLINSMDRSPRFAEPLKANRKQNSSAILATLR